MKKEKQISCHSRVFLSGISPLYPSPVVAEGRGFTLIELLIAVIIIGVLVAVAVPQYQKAVLKSRFSSLMPLGKALHDGNESYYLEHGSYTNDPTKLDVRANNSNAQITLGNEKLHKYVLLTRNDMHNKLVIYQKNSEFFPNETHCEALKTDTRANWLCGEGLKGTLLTERALSDGYNTYLLQGSGNGGFPKTWIDVSDQELERGDSCTTSRKVTSCNNIKVTDGVCTPGSSSLDSCSNSIFTRSTCEAGYGGGKSSTFIDSLCHGTGGGHRCEDSTFINSECTTTGHYSCTNGTFTNSVCRGWDYNTCTGTFDNSKCYGYSGYGWGACNNSTYKNGSVCYAQVTGSCSNTYKDTSYCAGDFCPNGTPSSDSTKKWYRGTGEDWPADRPSELVDK